MQWCVGYCNIVPVKMVEGRDRETVAQCISPAFPRNISFSFDNDYNPWIPSYSPQNSDPDDIKNRGVGMSIRGYSPIFSKWQKNPQKNRTSGRGRVGRVVARRPAGTFIFSHRKQESRPVHLNTSPISMVLELYKTGILSWIQRYHSR